MPEKTCKWYTTEDKDLDFVHCDDDNGFCLLRDLFTPCNGKCENYCEEKK